MKKQLGILPILTILSLGLIGCNSQTSSSAPQTFTITWKNYDGTVLETDEEVLEGTLPTYDGSVPEKAEDAQYNYVFSGWTPEIKEADADIEYVATFTNELRSYTVVWKDEDGTVLETDENVPYGTMPEFNQDDPTKEMTVANVYSFDGWDNEVATVTGDVVYTATYKEEARKYNVTWKNEDGSVIKTDEVAYGQTPAYEGDLPTKESTAQHKYTFESWSPNIVEVTGDVEYSATFKEEIRTYTVTWVNFDGEVLEVDEDVAYGETPVFNGENPTRPNGHGIEYTWRGWTPTIVPVYRDTVYTAKYNARTYFSFDLMDYDMKDGHSASELKGAPWINSNLRGQLEKINKPSLKDDFYAAVNYDDILNGVPGPFEVDDATVSAAMSDIDNNTGGTTNGNFLYNLKSKLYEGDATGVSNYLTAIDIDNYLSSKEVFSSESSFLGLYSDGTTYEVAFKDGYFRGNSGIQTLFFFGQYSGYSYVNSFTTTVIGRLQNNLNFTMSNSDIDAARSLDREFSNAAYSEERTYGGAVNSYTVDTLPWSQMKSALLDLGIAADETINIKKYYVNCFNYLFNNYAVNKKTQLKNDLILRLAFDYRYLLSTGIYKGIASQLQQTGFFPYDSQLTAYGAEYLPGEMIKIVTKDAFEQAYIELTSSEKTKNTVTNLIEDILQGYKDMMGSITWLGEQTKSNIQRKISKMKYASCYSDAYKNLPQVDETNIENISLTELYRRYYAAKVQESVNHVPEDDMEWAWYTMPSYTVNAFYTVQYNSFVILNGLVTGFLGERIEELYGMLGFVIGHEITHAFDSSGSRFDENGNYNDLMTTADRFKFDNKVERMVAFYNQVNAFDGNYVDGDNVNGEATADMGGIKVMLQLAESIPDFDYDKFFRAAAHCWCTQPYDDWAAHARLDDEHPFPYLRVNVSLAQFDKFIETYDIQPGDGMYIPEAQRVKIW